MNRRQQRFAKGLTRNSGAPVQAPFERVPAGAASYNGKGTFTRPNGNLSSRRTTIPVAQSGYPLLPLLPSVQFFLASLCRVRRHTMGKERFTRRNVNLFSRRTIIPVPQSGDTLCYLCFLLFKFILASLCRVRRHAMGKERLRDQTGICPLEGPSSR